MPLPISDAECLSGFRLAFLETDSEPEQHAEGLLGRTLGREICKEVRKAGLSRGKR